jgi:hypothetical protein
MKNEQIKINLVTNAPEKFSVEKMATVAAVLMPIPIPLKIFFGRLCPKISGPQEDKTQIVDNCCTLTEFDRTEPTF